MGKISRFSSPGRRPPAPAPAPVAAPHRSAPPSLRGIAPHTLYIPLPGKAILTRSVAERLELQVGDALEIRGLPSGPTLRSSLGALSDSALGNGVSLTAADAATGFALQNRVTSLLLTVDEGEKAAVRATMLEMDGVAAVQDLEVIRSQADLLTGLTTLLVGFMLLFAGVLAAAILYNTATMSIVERQRELATMRAMGFAMRRIAAMVLVENLLLGIGGLILGFPLAIGVRRLFLDSFRSDLFSMPFYLTPMTMILTSLAILVVLILAQGPPSARSGGSTWLTPCGFGNREQVSHRADLRAVHAVRVPSIYYRNASHSLTWN